MSWRSKYLKTKINGRDKYCLKDAIFKVTKFKVCYWYFLYWDCAESPS